LVVSGRLAAPVKAMTANDKRAERRVPVALRIRLRYSDVDQFISKFAINISRGGMFLSSRNPKPIGTHLQFEMRLVDDSPVIEGSGEVRWIREYDRHHPNQPHGMGIRFFELKPDSQVVLERIIEHRRSVGEPDTDSIPEPRAYEPAGGVPVATQSVSVVTQPVAAIPDPAPAADAEPSSGVESAFSRARRLLAGGFAADGPGVDDLERELAALLEPVDVPLETSIDAASRDLAARLGGEPVVRRKPAQVAAGTRASNGVEDTGSAEKVDPADVLEEMDAANASDVDMSDFASENDVPTSVGDPGDVPSPVDRAATPRAGRGGGKTARG
jgi:uncharacterized protein (TIGR02266 family)